MDVAVQHEEALSAATRPKSLADSSTRLAACSIRALASGLILNSQLEPRGNADDSVRAIAMQFIHERTGARVGVTTGQHRLPTSSRVGTVRDRAVADRTHADRRVVVCELEDDAIGADPQRAQPAEPSMESVSDLRVVLQQCT
jgi:hypothetical protein